jgi:hypothetical protein
LGRRVLRHGETRRAVASLPGDGSNGVVSAIMLGSEMLRLGNARIDVVRPTDDDIRGWASNSARLPKEVCCSLSE